MPFDGITLFGAIYELKEYLTGNRINKIYQPDKNELIFCIRRNRQEYKLLLSADSLNCRMHLTDTSGENPFSPPMFCMLLRKHLLGGKIESISQKGLERIVEIIIHNTDEYMQLTEYKLIAEIMGKHSNIILLDPQKNTVIDSIKRISFEINRYREILPGKTYINPPLEQKLDLISVDDNHIMSTIKAASVSKIQINLSRWILDNFAGFSGASAQEVALRAKLNHKIPISKLSDIEIQELTKVLIDLRHDLMLSRFSPHIYLNPQTKEPMDFWMFPMVSYSKEQELSNFTINNAIDFFFARKREVFALNAAKNNLNSQVKKHIQKLKQNLSYLRERANKTSDLHKYKLWGEILSANIYHIKPGQSQVKLPNFYSSNDEVLIPLNEKLSPSHNAQLYFKKYKKLQATKKVVEERINQTLMEIDYLESSLVNIEYSHTLEDLSEIQQELESQNYIKSFRSKLKKHKVSEPLRFKSSDGIPIIVGKNNRQNDNLTFKRSKPDDIWLHAKDTPGSHVVIKSHGITISETTLTEAAILAAYFSKGSSSSNVPVDYTLVRHVKKPAGAKPGFVIYYHQKTIYVTPDESIVEKLSF
jgi:predicted ribosome quality control (RQC) complex YloA/Tae2 family protein